MAKYLTEEEVAKMEEQAHLSQRMAAAQREMDPERQRREQWHKDLDKARETRLNSLGKVAMRDPGRYAPGTAAAARAELDRVESNRRFDEDINIREVESRNKMKGMIDQHKGKAEIEAAAAMEESRNKWGYRGEDGNWVPGGMERQEQIKADAQKEMAGIEGQTKKDVAGLQAQSQENIAKTQTQSQEKIVEMQQQTEAAKQQMTLIMQKANNDTEIEKARIAAGGKISVQKMKEVAGAVQAALKNMQFNGDPAKIVEAIRKQYADDPDAAAAAEALLNTQEPKKTGLAGDAI